MLKTLLIDDIPDALVALEELIKIYCVGKVEVIGTALNVTDALLLLKKTNPDLVFLDINMPGGSGFDFLDLQNNNHLKVIFTTADEKHALRAIKYRPIDYLLKPIDPDELQSAVQSLEKSETVDNAQLNSKNRIKISSQKELLMVDTSSIIYFEADGRYTKIYYYNVSKLITKNIGEFENELKDDAAFFRINRSYLINMNAILKIIREDSGYVEMANGKKIWISKNQKEKFMKIYVG